MIIKTIIYFFGLVAFNSFAQSAPWLLGIGGNEQDFGTSIAVDPSGNVYSAGMFGGTFDFDPGPGTTILFTTGIFDGYIMKSDPNGNLLWAKNFNSDNTIYITSVSIDSLNNVYTAGIITGNGDLDPGPGTYTVNSGGLMAFVVKLDVSGNFIWARTFDYAIYLRSMRSDNSGNIYLTGCFSGTADFDPGPMNYTLSAIAKDGYLLKLNSLGNFVWVKKQSSSSINEGAEGYVSTRDEFGSNYVTGVFGGTIDFDSGPGVYNLTALTTTINTQFILKTDASGNFVWAKKIGGSGNVVPLAIKVTSSGNVYTIGYFTSTVDFDPGAPTFNLNSLNSTGNAFISKTDPSGNFVWAKSLRCSGACYGNSMACDSLENVFITGSFQGVIDFNPGVAAVSYTAVGTDDIYILKLDSAGNYKWHMTGGGINSDVSNSIALDRNEVIYITGGYSSVCDFGSLSTNTLTALGSNEDIFVLKVGQLSNVGIQDHPKQNKTIVIYPNPNNGSFTVKTEKELKLQLTNSLGQTLQILELNSTNNYELNIELFASGIYFLSGMGEYQSAKQKIIVAR